MLHVSELILKFKYMTGRRVADETNVEVLLHWHSRNKNPRKMHARVGRVQKKPNLPRTHSPNTRLQTKTPKAMAKRGGPRRGRDHPLRNGAPRRRNPLHEKPHTQPRRRLLRLRRASAPSPSC